MSKITRRNFLKVSGVAAAAAALTACGGSSSTASSAASGAASSEAASTAAKLDKIKVAVPNDTTNEARALTLLEKCCAYDTYFEMLHDKVPPKNVFE